NCKDPLYDIERAPHRADVGVWAEITCAVVLELARHVDSPKRLLYRDLDVRIRFVVTKGDVESRPVLLDEIRLENQSMRFRRHDDRLEIGDLIDEVARLRTLGVILRVIAPNARPE